MSSGVRGYEIRDKITGTIRRYEIRGTRIRDPGYEDTRSGVRGYKIRGTRIRDPGYEGYEIRGTRVLDPGYAGMRTGMRSGYKCVRSGVRGCHIQGKMVGYPGYLFIYICGNNKRRHHTGQAWLTVNL